MEEQDWIDAGYRKWNCKHWREYADYALQKCVEKEGDKLYFINVYVYDWTKPEWEERGLSYRGATFSYEVALFLQDETQFTVSGEVLTIQELENWIASLYVTLKCIPDVHNN